MQLFSKCGLMRYYWCVVKMSWWVTLSSSHYILMCSSQNRWWFLWFAVTGVMVTKLKQLNREHLTKVVHWLNRPATTNGTQAWLQSAFPARRTSDGLFGCLISLTSLKLCFLYSAVVFWNCAGKGKILYCLDTARVFLSLGELSASRPNCCLCRR